MKNTWDKLGEDIHTLKDELETLLEMLPISVKFNKQTTSLNKAWKRFDLSQKKMNAFIIPVKSIEINSPLLKHADFAATWKFWKDYLLEQHGIHARSRTESMQLKQMEKITEGNPELGVQFLEYAMYRGTKSFFKVNETELPKKLNSQNNSDSKTTGMVISLPLKYKQVTLEEATKTEEDAKSK